MKMLVPAPYQAPEKKVQKKNKEAKDGLHCKGTSDGASGETETHSFEEDEDDEEEEEADSTLSPKGKKKKKRAASEDLEAEAPKRGKYPSQTAQIQTPRPSPSGAPGRSPLPNREYPKMPYIGPVLMSMVLMF